MIDRSTRASLRPASTRGGGWPIWNSPAFGLLGIGFQLAVSIAGLAIVGHWLDGKFGTDPALTLVGLVLGLAAGFYGAYRRLREVTNELNRRTRGGSGR